MSNIKIKLVKIIQEIWEAGFFDHKVDTKILFDVLKKHYEEKLAKQKECPKRIGKNHAWETHDIDGREKTFCTKCLIMKSFIDGKKDVLRELLMEL